MADDRHPLETVLGHAFADRGLLSQALTHRGALGVKGTRDPKRGAANERLEFLGDRVLGLVVAEALLKEFPGENEGALAQRLAALVSAPALTRVAEELLLRPHLSVAPGHEAEPGVLADACEAIIAAIYLDGGLTAAKPFILRYWEPLLRADLAPPKDPKTTLQEWAQARGLPLPIYRILKETGPAHAPSFIMAVSVIGHPEAHGEGRTKRTATRAAATALLAKLAEAT
jgi:ribonuclease-3